MIKLTYDAEKGRMITIEVVKMGFREQMVGQLALMIYLVVTHLAGGGFFQLPPESRAVWLLGAVAVLVGITIGGRPLRRV